MPMAHLAGTGPWVFAPYVNLFFFLLHVVITDEVKNCVEIERFITLIRIFNYQITDSGFKSL